MLGAMDPLGKDIPKDAVVVYTGKTKIEWQAWAEFHHDWDQYKKDQLFYAQVHGLWWPCETGDFFNGIVTCFAVQIKEDTNHAVRS